ncbi:MAG TPA: GNAT family N-acetyltransferase [Candidatus Magasanikbacteria bacterium]|nr:MAG: GNAT family N-acetyltransferase [Candidatus Magasanikbacteria bacterium RIFCSPLOWO2_02_FULL_47_16]OGH79823.1 MAG: GNAT family N-acetyltransferase [Candidatus Magasanikbacteria bacterium RIFCSPHIGHO2_02_FULL_48_18]OGH83045.1 MAG: GNAT family N-acetyltransferase [Candidatus Magasanikbacteria bacterium RIFCSPLOWO2_12_FULL_47_9b]HAZ28338.1 GNAT family N-acetyltransferase [Candidatus Magasanikbacteria bacterium]
MDIRTTVEKRSSAIKITVEEDGKTVGRVYLYFIFNDLHEKPYGLMEDLFVDEARRGQGIGTKLITTLIEEAKRLGCYKLVGQSRHSRPEVHALYERYGFQNHGLNFRMDF